MDLDTQTLFWFFGHRVISQSLSVLPNIFDSPIKHTTFAYKTWLSVSLDHCNYGSTLLRLLIIMSFAYKIDSPAELLIDEASEDAVAVSWNKVQASIDRYRVSYISADEETEMEKDKNVTTLTGLKPGTKYVIYLWAEKGDQQSKRASTEARTGTWAIDFKSVSYSPALSYS